MADQKNGTGLVRGLYLEGVQQIREELRSYWLNHAFLLGYQWIWWNQDTNRLDVIAHEADRIQSTMNVMRANMRTIVANLTQRELTFESLPTQYDDSTIRAARLGQAIIEDIRVAHGWESKREKLMVAALKGGTAALSVDWDDANKDTVETVLPLGDFVVEPGSLDAETARWWVRKQALPPKEVQAIYDLDKEPPADANAGLDPYMHKIIGDQLGSGDRLVPRTNVFTYYERPNPLCPEGKVLVEVDGHIIEYIEKWPFPWTDRLNLTVVTETAVENQWQGATILDDVRPVQVAFNAVWSNYLEHLRDAGNARLAVPSSSVDLIRSMTDVPGEILEYVDGTEKPSWLSPAQISGWLRDLAPMLKELIDDIMGVHDVSRGSAPANIESGLGLSILAEKDSSPVGRLIKQTMWAFDRTSQMNLMLFEKYATGKRTATVREGRTPTRTQWTGKDIQGQINIRVPVDAIQPKSRAAMQAFADKAMEMGLITNVIQYAKVADLPGQEDIIAAAAPDAAKARRENAAFEMSEVLLPAPFDDHAIHIEMHNEFRKTQRYELLSDDDRETVDLHVQAHETVSAQAAGKAQMQAMVSPALAGSPNADGSQIDPELLAQGAPPPGPPVEVPPPEAPPIDNAAIDPTSLTSQMLMDLRTHGAGAE